MNEPILRAEHLRKVYRTRRHGEIVAVDDVSFDIGRGEIVGLLGPNGAGKTTTIKCLAGLIRPTGGRVVLGGVDVTARPRAVAKRLAAVLEGNRNVYWRLTARENLEFFAALQGIPPKTVRAEVLDLLERFDLYGKRDTEGRALSRGMQQKLAVACVFVRRTPILLLDEPTLGLDVETSHQLRGMLREMAATDGRTILLSSHDMEVVQDVCERVLIVNEGRVVTSDRVANLLDLFRVRAYRFTLDGSLSDGHIAAIRTSFPSAKVHNDGHQATIDVELLDGARFYDMIDVLRRGGCVIESIDRRDPNLGEVFLRIVRGEVRG